MLVPDPSITKTLKDGKTPLQSEFGLGQSDIVQLAGEVRARLEQRMQRAGTPFELHAMASIAMDTISEIAQHERPHRLALQKLGVKLIREEFAIPEKELALKPELSDPFTIENALLDKAPAQKLLPRDPEVMLEISKRRLTNALVQGGAHFAQGLYFMGKAEIDQLDARLMPLYTTFMNIGDAGYWLFPVEMQAQMSKQMPPLGIGGLNFSGAANNGAIEVAANAANLPLLLHELGKGVLEALALHGLPHENRMRGTVLHYADQTVFEGWDLRVGPALWSKLLVSFGPVDKADRNLLLKDFFAQDAGGFHQSIRALLKRD